MVCSARLIPAWRSWLKTMARIMGAGNPNTMEQSEMMKVFRSVVPNMAELKYCWKYLKPAHAPP